MYWVWNQSWLCGILSQEKISKTRHPKLSQCLCACLSVCLILWLMWGIKLWALNILDIYFPLTYSPSQAFIFILKWCGSPWLISISLRLYMHFSSNGFLMFSVQAASMYLDVCGLKMNRKLGSKSAAVWLGGGREDFFPLGCVHLFPLKRNYGYPASS